MSEDLLKLEEDFAKAIVSNDADAVAQFVSDDWIIIDPDGGVIDKGRFLAVMRSGALTHEAMESTDVRLRAYGDTAVVTAVTSTKGRFMGQEFTSRERATDVFVKLDGRWQCVLTHLTRLIRQ